MEKYVLSIYWQVDVRTKLIPRDTVINDSDPLLFYRAIANCASELLESNGLVVLEINEKLGIETAELFKRRSFTTELHNDFRGKTRMLTAKL